MIYLITFGEREYCKIGYAKNVDSRLKQLQTSNPSKLELLYTIQGSIQDEKEIHKKFSEFVVMNEWFECTVDILNYFKNHTTSKSYERVIEADTTAVGSEDYIEWVWSY